MVPPFPPTSGQHPGGGTFSRTPGVPGQRDSLWWQRVPDLSVPTEGITCEYGERVPRDWRRQEAKGGRERERQHTVKGSSDRLRSHSSSTAHVTAPSQAGGTAGVKPWQDAGQQAPGGERSWREDGTSQTHSLHPFSETSVEPLNACGCKGGKAPCTDTGCTAGRQACEKPGDWRR